MAARAHDLEKVTEAFDAARDQLAALQAVAKDDDAKAQQAHALAVTAQQQVRSIARSAYTGQNSTFQALLTSRSADEFVGQVSTLQKIAGHQTEILDQANAAGTAAARAQSSATAAVAKAKATYDTVAAQQAQLQGEVNKFQADLDRLSAAQRQAAIAAAGAGDATHASRSEDRSAAPAGPVVASSAAAQTAVDTALAQRGKPYIWAAAGPSSFDCSGLMQYAYKAAGISLPHSSLAQSTMGTAVAKSDLQPGDLVFFYSPVSHVGMYIGNGQFVQAPTAGDVVKVTNLDSMSGYHNARRLVG
jgi:cell wall-associated NlpC family hydrolase